MRQVSLELLRGILPMRSSGTGHLQGIPAGFEQIKINRQHGNTTVTNVTRRVHTVGRPKLTTNLADAWNPTLRVWWLQM